MRLQGMAKASGSDAHELAQLLAELQELKKGLLVGLR